MHLRASELAIYEVEFMVQIYTELPEEAASHWGISWPTILMGWFY